MKRKNVLLLVNQLHGGGAQRVVANLSTELAGTFNVTLVIFDDPEKIDFVNGGELIKIKLPFAHDRFNNSAIKRLARFFSLTWQVRKLKRNRKIDVAISFLEGSNFVNLLTKKKEKTIVSVRSFLSHEIGDNPRLKLFKPLIKLLYNRADIVVTPAELTKIDLTENFGVSAERIRVIYNFIDKRTVTDAARTPLPPHVSNFLEHNRHIINIGRLSTAKAQWLLPYVLRILKNKIPTLKLVILGGGPEKASIIQVARHLNLQVFDESTDNSDISIENCDIYMPGFLPNPYPYLAHADILIKSSIFEGFPNVLIEAMIFSIPIVSADCPSGPREILSPDTDIHEKATGAEYSRYGVLVPAYTGNEKSKEEFIKTSAQVLEDLLTDSEKRSHYASRSTERAKDFSREKIIEQWISLIDEPDIN